MSESASRLPPRPSLEQLRKQARELLRACRSGDAAALARVHRHKPSAVEPILADVQYAMAREYGFESWPKLAHAVEVAAGILPFDSIARDLQAAFHGDTVALERLNERQVFHAPTPERLREILHVRHSLPESSTSDDPFTLADARRLVAKSLGFASWQSLESSLDAPAADVHDAPAGLSSRPPFYRIDWHAGSIEPRQPMTPRDWDTILAVMAESGLTGLNANGQMTNEAMDRVSRAGHITSLNLGGSKRLTDDGLLMLARMPQLVELDVSEYPGGRLTNGGLRVLRELRELRRFAMCWQRGISDAGVAHLAYCDQLERVDLLGSTTGDGAIEALAGKRRLRFLKTGRNVTDAGLSRLHEFPVFKTWHGGEPKYDLMSFGDAEPNFLMVDGPFTDAGFAGLVGLDGVFGLGFFRHVSRLTSNGLAPLAGMANLGALACEGTLCDDEAMAHIARIPNLRMLMAQGTVAGDTGFERLSHSSTLEYLWGRECPNLQGPGLAALARAPSLRGLAVSLKLVDDASLATLPQFPALTWLLPMDLSDDGFRHVGRCERLEKLTCMYCRDTGDAATEHIEGLSHLQHYYAGQTRITDRSLEVLGGMPSLQDIALSGCPGISDAGLAHLAGLPHLRRIAVDATARVTRAGTAVFRPGVHIDFWT